MGYKCLFTETVQQLKVQFENETTRAHRKHDPVIMQFNKNQELSHTRLKNKNIKTQQ
uniref:Uncharacterized protein n=1 Tax=Anguilla anguilla TaxID=7936 RepID=A0A0E9WMJ3_ANGAN